MRSGLDGLGEDNYLFDIYMYIIFNHIHSSYIVLGIISNLEMI